MLRELFHKLASERECRIVAQVISGEGNHVQPGIKVMLGGSVARVQSVVAEGFPQARCHKFNGFREHDCIAVVFGGQRCALQVLAQESPCDAFRCDSAPGKEEWHPRN